MKYLRIPAGLFFAAWLLLPYGVEALEAKPAKACQLLFSPDALKELAQICAKNPSLDENCRAHANDGGVEYVIVRDCSAKKPAGYLLIPVWSVTGVDDRQILGPDFQNLWQNAWEWSHTYPGLPEAQTALAVNSKNGRSQNQLHIHISCIRPDVGKALESSDIPYFPAKAVTLALGPEHNAYQAVRVKSLTGDSSPFHVVAMLPGAARNMKDQSMAVIGSKNKGDYYIVNTTFLDSNQGHAEELLDQTCTMPAL